MVYRPRSSLRLIYQTFYDGVLAESLQRCDGRNASRMNITPSRQSSTARAAAPLRLQRFENIRNTAQRIGVQLATNTYLLISTSEDVENAASGD